MKTDKNWSAYSVIAAVFSLKGTPILSALTSLGIALFYKLDQELFIIILLAGQWACIELLIAVSILKGQPKYFELRLNRKGLGYWSLRIFKLPLRFLMLLGSITFPICCLVYLALTMPAEMFGLRTQMNIKALALFWATNEVILCIYWILHWREYYYPDREEAKKKLLRQGLSAFEAEARLKKDWEQYEMFGPKKK